MGFKNQFYLFINFSSILCLSLQFWSLNFGQKYKELQYYNKMSRINPSSCPNCQKQAGGTTRVLAATSLPCQFCVYCAESAVRASIPMQGPSIEHLNATGDAHQVLNDSLGTPITLIDLQHGSNVMSAQSDIGNQDPMTRQQPSSLGMADCIEHSSSEDYHYDNDINNGSGQEEDGNSWDPLSHLTQEHIMHILDNGQIQINEGERPRGIFISNKTQQRTRMDQLTKIVHVGECSICCHEHEYEGEDNISEQSETNRNEQDGVRLQCGHQFHSQCLEPWLEQRGTCPCCRKQIN